MATLASAQAKWERKTANAGTKWQQATQGKGAAYAAGLTRFGAPPSGSVVSAYEQGVSAVSAADFQASIAGKGSKYAENLRRGLAAG
jgi:hypothetical protein